MAIDARALGRRQVMSGIRKAGRVARVDLARDTGISQATVTTITAELIRAGLIEETKRDDSPSDARRGRPRVDLKVRGDAHLVAGIKLSDVSLSAILADFENTPLAEHSVDLPAEAFDADTLAAVIETALRDLTAKAGRKPRDLSGVGLGISGVVDGTRGFVYWSPSLKRRNVDLRAALQTRLGLPVFLDNDANLVAVAEQYYGEGRNASDFLVVTVEHGVGMGIVLANQVYRGTRGCGAEFGHTKVQLEGALCRCGQRGCLEAYVGDYALLREANIRGSAQPEDDLSALHARAKAGDAMARSIFDRAGRMFAMGLANVINIFDPSLVILSGEQMTFDFLYSEEVLNRVKASVVQVDAPLPEIRVHKWGDLMWAKGAAACGMEGVSELTIRNLATNAA